MLESIGMPELLVILAALADEEGAVLAKELAAIAGASSSAAQPKVAASSAS